MRGITYINLAFEDPLSRAVLGTIVRHANPDLRIHVSYGGRGSGYLKKKINGFNSAARHIPFIILSDLNDVKCAPIMINEWLPYGKSDNLVFRIAVQEVESWLLADRKSFSHFMGIPKSRIPFDSDSMPNPKEFLINLARKSRRNFIRDSVVPKKNSYAHIGPDYNGALTEYTHNYWNINSALKNSNSLKRAVNAIKMFKPSIE